MTRIVERIRGKIVHGVRAGDENETGLEETDPENVLLQSFDVLTVAVLEPETARLVLDNK